MRMLSVVGVFLLFSIILNSLLLKASAVTYDDNGFPILSKSDITFANRTFSILSDERREESVNWSEDNLEIDIYNLDKMSDRSWIADPIRSITVKNNGTSKIYFDIYYSNFSEFNKNNRNEINSRDVLYYEYDNDFPNGTLLLIYGDGSYIVNSYSDYSLTPLNGPNMVYCYLIFITMLIIILFTFGFFLARKERMKYKKMKYELISKNINFNFKRKIHNKKRGRYKKINFGITLITIVILLALNIILSLIDHHSITKSMIRLMAGFITLIIYIIIMVHNSYYTRNRLSKGFLIKKNKYIQSLDMKKSYHERIWKKNYLGPPLFWDGFVILLGFYTILDISNKDLILIYILTIIILYVISNPFNLYFEINGDESVLEFHYRPSIPILNLFNPDVQIRYQEVYSIRPLNLDIWGDYQAFTFHVEMGPEGEDSYITNIPTGVRITLKDGSEYIVSTRYPMELTQLVKSKMMNKEL